MSVKSKLIAQIAIILLVAVVYYYYDTFPNES